MLRMLVFLCVGLLSLCAKASYLKELKPSSSGHAVVLLGGIGNDYGYFHPWMDELRDVNASVHGFVHDHRASSMSQGAQALAEGLRALSRRGIHGLTVLAHSMGGLVAKKALHLLTPQEVARFGSLELRTYGTPWGGFFMANFARWIPGSQPVVNWLGYPMSSEIGSRSRFMRSLRAPLPAHVRWVVYESIDDDVARPAGASARRQYQRVVARATEVRRLRRVRHDAFVEVLAFSF